MIKELQNSGIITLNKAEHNEEEKTIIVVGVERSGTSMVGTVLNELNIFLGDSHDKAVFEDIRIFSSLESENFELFESLVTEYNSRHKIWGWKRPKSFTYSDRFVGRVRNPHFVVLFRDSFSIAVRNSISVHVNVTKNLIATAKKNLELAEFVAECKYPMLCVSYEKAMMKKKQFLQNLVDYIGIEIDEEHQKRVLSSMVNGKTEYLLGSRLDKDGGVPGPVKSPFGRVDKISELKLSGWARLPQEDEPLQLKIMKKDEVLGTVVADQFRQDLKDNNVGSGDHAFSFTYPEPVTDIENVYVLIEKNNEKIRYFKA